MLPIWGPRLPRLAGEHPHATGSSSFNAAAIWVPTSDAYAGPSGTIHAATTIVPALSEPIFSVPSANTTAYGAATVAPGGAATISATTRVAEEEEEEEACCGCGRSSSAWFGTVSARYGAARADPLGMPAMMPNVESAPLPVQTPPVVPVRALQSKRR
jgi:hypothetical protein